MFNNKFAKFAAIGYLIMAILCFGPATVQSEKARVAQIEECKETYGKDASCFPSSFAADGLPKSIFWPLWLSYTIAEGL